jgi:DNA-nicking Smr family endonuclease
MPYNKSVKFSASDMEAWEEFKKSCKKIPKINKKLVAAEDSKKNEVTVPKRKEKCIAMYDNLQGLKAISNKPLELGARDGIDAKLVRKMDLGKMPIDATIDLHGNSLDQAFAKFNAFIESCYYKGCRTLLVITGKGSRSSDKSATINNELPKWINNSYIREKVLRFSYSHPIKGGKGAYLVLLKRKK